MYIWYLYIPAARLGWICHEVASLARLASSRTYSWEGRGLRG